MLAAMPLVAHAGGRLRVVLSTGLGRTPVHFVVADPSGRRAGRMSDDGPLFQEIPKASYKAKVISRPKTNDPNPVADIPLSSGTYVVTVHAVALSTYTVRLESGGKAH